MAQTRKKRRRKHRGTQAGTVGGKRRSRPRSRAEARAQARSRATSNKSKSGRKQRVADRVGAPPTWRGAVNRALIAAAIFMLLLVLLFRRPFLEAFGLSAFMLLAYIPMGYYMDRFFYRMRTRREERKRLELRDEKGKG